MKDLMRKEFEVWAESRGLDLYCSRKDIYEDTETLWAWSAWKASREAVTVELPELHTMAPDDDKKWHGCRNSTIRTCARAIQNAGLKVKE